MTMNIIEAIRERRSVRSFADREIPEQILEELVDYAAHVHNPFGGHFTIRLKKYDIKDGFKPSTYGMIKGADHFFLMGISDDDLSWLAAGFCFEQVVLKSWQSGLGSCWIAGTFKGTEFEQSEQWPDGENLKIICPIGYPAPKRLMEKMTRMVVGSNNRKPYGTLFFTDDFRHPLSPDSRFGEALEMLRLAPSSTNSQPWRALVEGDVVHFYYVSKGRISVLDSGIGICHFFLTEQVNGKQGEFFTLPSAPAEKDNWKYLVSYKSL